MAAPPKSVLKLVETFDRNIETYHSQQYNEAQLRREFVDPLFEELGWDITNKLGYAQAYKEVIHEDAVKVGSATKAPDYSFRIGGTRKFFLEAKKPSIDIKGDPHPAYQLRRYAWSAKLPLSILTDFEEFAVYDCRMRPKQTDGTSTARIMLLTYKDYIDKWDQIADIFSKESVLKGSFDKFAVSAKAKRGTTTVDKEFLAELEKWRSEFARIIALRNTNLSAHEINFAVQRTIDRIIFLRMCEDRGIEQYGQLQIISNGDRTYPRLCEIFERADEKYNSGLFHFHQEKGRAEPPDELTLNLTIDDAPLKYVLHSLYYPLCPYEFSVLPAEILGNVYEQFLGSVIEVSQGRRTKIEPKPEVKKAGGIYYTPDYIVDYIVKNTVGRLLCHSERLVSAKRSEDGSEESIKNGHCEERSDEAISIQNRKPVVSKVEPSKIVNRKSLTPKEVANLRILDPACGSGSFLLGAYTYLLNYHRDWYVENNPESWLEKKNPPIYQGRGGQWFLTIDEKKKILLDNIFGVDIDSQAVEVTKLSLLLKVLEGESQETIENQMRMFRERALPDLGNNIKCGNSLIAPDFFDNLDPSVIASDLSRRSASKSEAKQSSSRLAVAGTATQLSSLDDLRSRINPFDWHTEFPQIFKQGGFDAVIGNPPWGGDIDSITKYIEKKYPKSTQGYRDTSKLFIDRGLQLIRKKGFFSFIVPSAFMFQPRYIDIRRLVRKFYISKVWNIGDKVFGPDVAAPCCVIVVEKDTPKNNSLVSVLDTVSLKDNFERATIVRSPNYRNVPQSVYEKTTQEVFVTYYRGLQRNEVKLAEILDCKDCGIKHQRVGVGMEQKGKSDLASRLYYDGAQQHPEDRKYLTGSDLSISGWFMNYYVERYFRGNFKNILRKNEIVYFNEDVFNLPQKIVWRQTSDRIRATIIGPHWFANTLQAGVLRDQNYDLRYILGLLNSSFLNFIYIETVKESGRVFPQVKLAKVSALPVRTIDFDNPDDKDKHDKMVKLVERMLDLHKKLASAKVPDEKTKLQRQISAADSQIDRLVYDLYGLTEEEIKIAEGTDS